MFLMLEQLGLAWKDPLAAVTSEVITSVVRFQCKDIWSVEATSDLQAVSMC